MTPSSVRMLNQNVESVGDRDGDEDGEEQESWREGKFPNFSQLHFGSLIRFQLGVMRGRMGIAENLHCSSFRRILSTPLACKLRGYIGWASFAVYVVPLPQEVLFTHLSLSVYKLATHWRLALLFFRLGFMLMKFKLHPPRLTHIQTQRLRPTLSLSPLHFFLRSFH